MRVERSETPLDFFSLDETEAGQAWLRRSDAFCYYTTDASFSSVIADCPFRRLDPTRGSVFVDLGAWHFVVFSDGRASSRVTKATFCGTSSLTASTETERVALDNLAAS